MEAGDQRPAKEELGSHHPCGCLLISRCQSVPLWTLPNNKPLSYPALQGLPAAGLSGLLSGESACLLLCQRKYLRIHPTSVGRKSAGHQDPVASGEGSVACAPIDEVSAFQSVVRSAPVVIRVDHATHSGFQIDMPDLPGSAA